MTNQMPLNPRLYEMLEIHFGRRRVVTQHAGTANTATRARDSRLVGEMGEYYAVACPFCTDTRTRLWINHRWGVADPDSPNGNLWLAICYKNNCLQETARKKYELRDMLLASARWGKSVLVNAPIAKGKPALPMRLPTAVRSLDKLPPDHPAVRYVVQRRYDPAYLAKFYRVGYVDDDTHFLARDRLFIPLLDVTGKKLLGWQARSLEPADALPDFIPKYWTAPGTKKSQTLYGIHRANGCHTGVMVEGPTDVWRLGRPAVASLGFPCSVTQADLFVKTFSGGAGVLLFDTDVFEDPVKKKQFDKVHAMMVGKFKDGLAVVHLPTGDPANYEKKFLYDFIKKEAKTQGVKVRWEMCATAVGALKP